MKQTLLLIPVLSLLAYAVVVLPSSHAEDGSLQILKFEADWCGPCQQMKPIFKKVSEKYRADVAFQSINVDTQSSFADRFNIEELPTIVAVKNGREVGRSTGFMSAWRLSSFVRKYR